MAAQRTRSARGEGARLRGELVAAATELLIARGPEPELSLRAVARSAGVAPSAVYLWFPSQAELLAAVLEEQFTRLGAALAAADDEHRAPAGRLRSLAHAYMAWAVARPGAYRLLFERPDAEGAGHAPGAELLDRVGLLVAAHDPVSPDPAGVARRLWAALHGLASLQIHKSDPEWGAFLKGDVDAVVTLHLGRTPPGPPA